MPLTDKARVELERRGPTNIRLLLISRNLLASGTGARVPIDLGPEDPLLGDVEEWLAQKERDEGRRANWMLWGAVVAAVAAIVAALAAISAAIEGAIQLLHQPH